MRSYRFRLSTVERIRVLEERVARDQLMASLRAVREAHAERAAAMLALSLMASPTGVVSALDVRWHGDQAHRLHEALVERTENVTSLTSASEAARAKWDVAARRASVLERLDADGRRRWRDEAQREETAELDDLMNARFRRAGGVR